MHKDIRDLFDQLDRLGVKVTHLWPSCGEPRAAFGHPPFVSVEFDAKTLPRLTAALAGSETTNEEEPVPSEGVKAAWSRGDATYAIWAALNAHSLGNVRVSLNDDDVDGQAVLTIGVPKKYVADLIAALTAAPAAVAAARPVAELEAKLAKATAEVDVLRVQRDQMQQKVHVAEASLATLLRGLEALGRR